MAIMQGIKRGINKMTGKDLTDTEKYQKKMKARQDAINRVLQDRLKKQEMVLDCLSILDQCETEFKSVIQQERARAMQMSMEGYSTEMEQGRIRECAIGILVAREARYKVNSILSDSDMNLAMNNLGQALRQINRLNNGSNSISLFNERALDKWCPGIVDDARKLGGIEFEIPEEKRSEINQMFVDDLMNGNDYDTCRERAQMRRRAGMAQKAAGGIGVAQDAGMGFAQPVMEVPTVPATEPAVKVDDYNPDEYLAILQLKAQLDREKQEATPVLDVQSYKNML